MKVSIITVSFNSEETIEDTIKSVLSQTYTNIEYIIIDGKSSDGTMHVVEKYRDKISFIISEKDEGIYDAMNKGIQAARGELIGILNSDDLYSDADVIGDVVKKVEETDSDCVWGDLIYVDKEDISRVTRYWRGDRYEVGKFISGWHPPHPTFFVRKNIYEKYGIFRKDLSLAADYELMLRFLEKNKISSTYIPRVLVKMRDGGASNWRNLKNIIKGNLQCYKAWKLNGLRVAPLIVFIKPLRKIKQIFQA